MLLELIEDSLQRNDLTLEILKVYFHLLSSPLSGIEHLFVSIDHPLDALVEGVRLL